jgi:hypothetical protein
LTWEVELLVEEVFVALVCDRETMAVAVLMEDLDLSEYLEGTDEAVNWMVEDQKMLVLYY